MSSISRHEAKAIQSQVEHEQRIDGQRHAVLDDSTSAKNADSSSQGPETQNAVDWYPDDDWDV